MTSVAARLAALAEEAFAAGEPPRMEIGEHGIRMFCRNDPAAQKAMGALINCVGLIPGLAKALEACADEAESWIKDYYTDHALRYPGEKRRYERDIACVNDARSVLAALGERLDAEGI